MVEAVSGSGLADSLHPAVRASVAPTHPTFSRSEKSFVHLWLNKEWIVFKIPFALFLVFNKVTNLLFGMKLLLDDP